MTVDVEEHFQVSAFADAVDRADWERLPSRVEANTDKLLALFDEARLGATFFVLGWVGKRHPALVRRLVQAGHEVACHGWSHRLVYSQSREQFQDEVARARATLEDAAGEAVVGYRAASFSIKRENLWALDVLVECGFTYDSSIFPVHHDRYGVPGAPRHIHRVRTPGGATIVEVPPSTVRIAGLVLAVAGGGYLRHFPWAVTRWSVRRLNEQERAPAIVYIHPWEVDPDQPRVEVPWLRRLRHYGGMKGTYEKLHRLVQSFPFGRMSDVLARVGTLEEHRL